MGAVSACRVAILQKAFLEELEPGKASQAQGTSAKQSEAEAVRPGSFLPCVIASKAEMSCMQGAQPTIRKLEVIGQEALSACRSQLQQLEPVQQIGHI